MKTLSKSLITGALALGMVTASFSLASAAAPCGDMKISMTPQGTWTVLVTDTSGTDCIIATGQDWQEVPIALAGLDS